MKLRKHQKEFLDKNPDRALLAWEMRVGKSLPASIWSNHPSRNSNPIVVCPKQLKSSWQKEAPHATVYTKEEFIDICKQVGFTQFETYSDWSGTPYLEDSEDMIIVAKK